MRQRNDGQGEINALQNHFTAYLLEALWREKRTYTYKKSKREKQELPFDIESAQYEELFASKITDSIPFKMRPEYLALVEALELLTKRERYVLFETVLYGLRYEELAGRLGLRYSGAAAVYHRLIKKLRKELR